jgi:hypothetical protein
MSEDPSIRITTLNSIIAQIHKDLENTSDPILDVEKLRELSKRQKELAQLEQHNHNNALASKT